MNLRKVQQSVRDYEGERGKTVLLRCDLNITEQDNTRIFIVKPTICGLWYSGLPGSRGLSCSSTTSSQDQNNKTIIMNRRLIT